MSWTARLQASEIMVDNTHRLTRPVKVTSLPPTLPSKPTAILNLLLPTTFLALLLGRLMFPQLLWHARY